MKKILFATLVLSAFVLGACTSMDDIAPQGGTLLASQVTESTNADPTRADALYTGMYTKLGEPLSVFGSRNRPDDWGFIMSSFSNDVESGDIVLANNGYNWFSVCGELSSRNANYANPYIRYACCYNEIAAANDVIRAYPSNTEDKDIIAKVAQAYAIRAFSYLCLAPYYQFRYATSKDQPDVPLVTLETTDFTNNPRATVAQVYDQIISDLTYAIDHLDGYTRTDKSKIDQQVAYGLRARAYLNMEEWDKALADAQKAAEGYTPATKAEVSKPFLMDISEHNWLWGYDMTTTVAAAFTYATSSSWLRSFSSNGYSASCAVYARCNNILYNKIPSTDVRKGWWVDENLNSPLLNGLTWGKFSGQAIAPGVIENEKEPFQTYTNVKFGTNPIGTTTNDEDWCFMRVEEMLLIEAECYAKSGNTAKAQEVLNAFVRTYRDPSYDCATTGRTLADEIWFQRRIELWGEGFANNDIRRLGKPMVRFTDAKSSIVPEAFRFNMTADDGWWLLRFTTSEMNTNFAIVDNTGGSLPKQDQNPELRDGVTD
jgi:tetratricopeptide (TPR) repeat protein